MTKRRFLIKGGKGNIGLGGRQIVSDDIIYLYKDNDNVALISRLSIRNSILEKKVNNLQQTVFYNRVKVTYDLLEDFPKVIVILLFLFILIL